MKCHKNKVYACKETMILMMIPFQLIMDLFQTNKLTFWRGYHTKNQHTKNQIKTLFWNSVCTIKLTFFANYLLSCKQGLHCANINFIAAQKMFFKAFTTHFTRLFLSNLQQITFSISLIPKNWCRISHQLSQTKIT